MKFNLVNTLKSLMWVTFISWFLANQFAMMILDKRVSFLEKQTSRIVDLLQNMIT